MSPLNRIWAGLLCVALLVIYLPGLGHGFIKDDFEWIAESRVTSFGDMADLLLHARGFYRPVVSLTFSLNYWMFGLEPFGYGLTNLVLVLGIGLAIWSLGRALGMPSGAAIVAAAFWTLNFHGIRMSILWISGRTALLVTLFAVLAAQAYVTKRTAAAAAWCLLALLSKEEAVLLPVILVTWDALLTADTSSRAGERIATVLRNGWPVFVPLVLYAVLRLQTDAMTPGSAPPSYQFSVAPGLLVRNLLEYFDRAASLILGTGILLSIVVWYRPRLPRRNALWMTLGVAWMAGGYAVTLFLPVRSSLYACFPSVGAALAGAAYLHALWADTGLHLRRRMVVAGVTLAIVGIPVHWTRNQSWIRPAELSTRVLERLPAFTDTLPSDAGVLIRDDPTAGTRLEHALGSQIRVAADLYVARPIELWVDPPPTSGPADLLTLPEPDRIALTLVIRNGELRRDRVP